MRNHENFKSLLFSKMKTVYRVKIKSSEFLEICVSVNLYSILINVIQFPFQCPLYFRAVWFDEKFYPKSWQLDPTEGPCRVRKRLQRCHLDIKAKFFMPDAANKLCEYVEYVTPDLIALIIEYVFNLNVSGFKISHSTH